MSNHFMEFTRFKGNRIAGTGTRVSRIQPLDRSPPGRDTGRPLVIGPKAPVVLRFLLRYYLQEQCTRMTLQGLWV